MSDWLAKGKEALVSGDWRAARDAFARAEESAEALEGLAVAAWWLDDSVAVFSAREQAYRLYRRRGDRRGAGRVATTLAEAHVHFRGEVAVARGWLRRARRLLDGLDAIPERGWLALWEGDLGLEAGDDLDDVRRAALEAATIARALGDVDLEMTALALEGIALVTAGELAQGMRRLDESTTAAVSGEMADPVAIGLSCCYLMRACERLLDLDRASEWCARVKEVSERMDFAALFSVCRAEYAGVLVWRGDWREAERELEAAIGQLGHARRGLQAEGLVRLAELRRQQGRLDDAIALLDRVEGQPLELLVRARVALDRGDARGALRCAERHLRRAPRSRRPDRAAALEVVARAQAALGRRVDAATLDELREIAESVGTSALRAGARMAEGAVAAASEDHARACEAFEDAVELYADSPYQQACARLELARSLDVLGEASAAKAELAKAERTLDELGVERPRGLARAGRSPGSLTPREIEVLPLLAEGLNNRQIGERLHVSELTVKRHVANILGKLDLPSRAAAAAYAARNRLVD